jgi:hypothetical protein
MPNHHGIFVNELASRKVAILRNRYSNEAHHKKYQTWFSGSAIARWNQCSFVQYGKTGNVTW